ncbi:MAG: lytic transglycosylase domain-containing protein [Bacillota bacterium]
MRRHSRLLWAVAGAIIPLILAFVPSPGSKLVASPPQAAARQATPADDRAAAVRRMQDGQLAILEARIEARRQLVADLDSIADLVPPQYRLLCIEEARRIGVEPRTLAALGWVESRWQPDAVGTSAEIGILQLMPETAAWVAERLGVEEYDLTDPATNVRLGASYLYWLIRENGGSIEDALAAYNGGPAWRTRAPQAARGYVNRVRAAVGGGPAD